MRSSFKPTGAFTLIELLVVLAIICVVMGIFLPTLGAARRVARKAQCGMNLHSTSVAVAAFITDHNQCMPFVDDALFAPATGAAPVWTGDPTDTALYPYSFINVMRDYIIDPGIMVCPDAIAGYPTPAANYRMTYRIASADNYDGQVYFNGQGSFDDAYNNNTLRYDTNLKYFDGRRYEVRSFDILTLKYVNDEGDYYLLRDLNGQMPDGTIYATHNGEFNQLYLDLHTAFSRPPVYALTYP